VRDPWGDRTSGRRRRCGGRGAGVVAGRWRWWLAGACPIWDSSRRAGAGARVRWWAGPDGRVADPARLADDWRLTAMDHAGPWCAGVLAGGAGSSGGGGGRAGVISGLSCCWWCAAIALTWGFVCFFAVAVTGSGVAGRRGCAVSCGSGVRFRAVLSGLSVSPVLRVARSEGLEPPTF